MSEEKAAEVVPASRTQIEQAISAVLHGVVGETPSNYTGVSKDEALEYAADLALLAQRVLHLLDDKPWPLSLSNPYGGDVREAVFGERRRVS